MVILMVFPSLSAMIAPDGGTTVNWVGIGFAFLTMVLWGFSPLFDKLALRTVSPLAGLTVRVMAAPVLF